jgi:isopenicillin-N epimerase
MLFPATQIQMEEITESKRPKVINGEQMTPCGFHTLEYRWAFKEALEFMLSIGKQNVCRRVHDLNRQCKEVPMRMPHPTLHTPLSNELSAGIISFDVEDMSAGEVVERLEKKKVIATVSPYKDSSRQVYSRHYQHTVGCRQSSTGSI